jgi:hypothetical protein
VAFTIALLLRVSLGLGLLNLGLVGYLSSRFGGGVGRGMGGMRGFGGIPGMASAAPLEALQFVPIVQIAVGLALVFGFFTTYAALAAGLVAILEPAMTTIMILGSGTMAGPQGMFNLYFGSAWGVDSVRLLLIAAIAWLSSSGINPFSIDALVHGRVEPSPVSLAYREPNPGEHAATIIASLVTDEESPRPGTTA